MVALKPGSTFMRWEATSLIKFCFYSKPVWAGTFMLILFIVWLTTLKLNYFHQQYKLQAMFQTRASQNMHMNMNHLEILLKWRSWCIRCRVGPESTFLTKLVGAANGAGPWTTLWAARLCRTDGVPRQESEMSRAILALSITAPMARPFILCEFNPLP